MLPLQRSSIATTATWLFTKYPVLLYPIAMCLQHIMFWRNLHAHICSLSFTSLSLIIYIYNSVEVGPVFANSSCCLCVINAKCGAITGHHMGVDEQCLTTPEMSTTQIPSGTKKDTMFLYIYRFIKRTKRLTCSTSNGTADVAGKRHA